MFQFKTISKHFTHIKDINRRVFYMENKEMELKVAEAFSQADVGRSIARIDPACMQ